MSSKYLKVQNLQNDLYLWVIDKLNILIFYFRDTQLKGKNKCSILNLNLFTFHSILMQIFGIKRQNKI
jgi:hypothetical protein